jgi:hypothetical protein
MHRRKILAGLAIMALPVVAHGQPMRPLQAVRQCRRHDPRRDHHGPVASIAGTGREVAGTGMVDAGFGSLENGAVVPGAGARSTGSARTREYNSEFY